MPTLHDCSLISLLSSSSWPERTKHIIAHAGVTVKLFTNNPFSKWCWLNHPFQKIFESKPGIYVPQGLLRVKFKKLQTSASGKPTPIIHPNRWCQRQWDLGAKRDGQKTHILNILESYTNQQKPSKTSISVYPGRPTGNSCPLSSKTDSKCSNNQGIHTFSCFLTFQHLGRAVLKPADPNG